MVKHNSVDDIINRLSGDSNPYKYTVSNNLYLVINPNNSKYWRWDYKYQGKRNTLSLGVYPKVSLFDAVLKANEAMEQLKSGFDPAPRKKDKPTKNNVHLPTFREVTLKYAETRGVSWNTTNGRNMNLFRNYLFPAIGDKAISEIKPAQLLKIINKISETGKDKATRALNSCLSIYSYAIKEKICKINVVLETKELRNQKN